MTKTSLLLSAVSLFLSITGVAGAQQTQGTLAGILETKTIKLGHLDQSFPFSFADDKGLQASAIDVDTRDQVVTLRGTVPSLAAKARAEELAREAKGVTAVINALVVREN